MKKIFNYIACAVLFLLASCYGKNENNFHILSKSELSSFEVKVNGVVQPNADTSAVFLIIDNAPVKYKENITRVSNDDVIDIAVEHKFEEGFTPSYKWFINELSGVKDPITNKYPEGKFLGETKDVSFKINGAPVKYVVYCVITNTTNNTEENIAFIFQINKPGGLAILHDNASGGDYDFIRTAKNTVNLNDTEHYTNVFSTYNSGSKIPNPKFIHYNASGMGVSANFVFLNKNSSMYGLNPTSYLLTQTDYNKFFALSAPKYNDLGYCYFSNGGQPYIYLIADGTLYTAKGSFLFGVELDKNKYSHVTFENLGSTPGNARAILFDKNKKAFRYGNWNVGIYEFTTSSTSLFNLNDTKMDLIYGESGYDNLANVIMKDDKNKLHFCVLDLKYHSSNQKEVSAVSKDDITNLQGLTESSLWAMNTRGTIGFYSSGNKVYAYNHSLKTVAVYDFTFDGNITMLNVFKNTSSSATGINSCTLYVGTDKNMLYEAPFDVTTGAKTEKPVEFKLSGKPIYMRYI